MPPYIDSIRTRDSKKPLLGAIGDLQQHRSGPGGLGAVAVLFAGVGGTLSIPNDIELNRACQIRDNH